MILTCPSCGTRYRADPASFTAPGRNVRCAKCSNVWFQPAPEPEPAPAPATAEPAAPPRLSDMRAERNASTGFRGRLSERTRSMAGERIAQAIAVILILFLLAGIGWAAVHYRQGVVRLWPESARLYGVAGLQVTAGGVAIPQIELRRGVQDGVPTLLVSGKVVNVSDRDQPIPRLRVVLFDDSKRELYRWTFDPGFRSLPPRSERDFGTTLPSPPPDARSADVSVAADDGQ